MLNILLLVIIIVTVISALLVLLNKKKVITLKSKPIVVILYTLLVVGIIYIALSLLGGPLLNKINEYRQGVLQEAEEECKKENAPYWCHL